MREPLMGCSRSAPNFSRSQTVCLVGSMSRTRRLIAPIRRAPDSRWNRSRQQLELRVPRRRGDGGPHVVEFGVRECATTVGEAAWLLDE